MRLLGLVTVAAIAAAQGPAPTAGKGAENGWKPMFDGASLQGWKETPFSGRGKVRVVDGAIELGKGYMTGVNWTGKLPKRNYEVRLEAMRADGYDFFAGITFPIQDA